MYTFGKPAYNSTNDPYQQRKPQLSRTSGKQFTTNPTRRGRVGSGVLFSSYEYQSEATAAAASRRPTTAPTKRRIATPFRFTSPSKKASGSGSHYGCIGPPPEYMPDRDPPRDPAAVAEMIKNRRPGRRNIITNPPKKGTYGYSGTTLQKDIIRHPESDPYDTYRVTVREEKKKLQDRMSGKKPFRSTCKRVDAFDSHPNVAASRVFSVPDNIPPKKVRADAGPKKVPVPFKPASPTHGTINPHPPYVSDPYDGPRVTGEKTNPPAVFRPTGISKSGPTRSVVFGSSRGLM